MKQARKPLMILFLILFVTILLPLFFKKKITLDYGKIFTEYYKIVVSFFILPVLGFIYREKFMKILNSNKANRIEKKIKNKLRCILNAMRSKNLNEIKEQAKLIFEEISLLEQVNNTNTKFLELKEYKLFIDKLNKHNFNHKIQNPEYQQIINLLEKWA